MTDPVLVENKPTPALRIDGLVKAYRGGFWNRRGKPAVDGLSLTVRRGEVFALLGHNGAGKTTTLKALLGLVRPDAGALEIAGMDARRPESRARVGYLPEAPYFHENLTAAELLDFYGRLLGLDRRGRRERTALCLDTVGMADHATRRLGDCSKGMRQRIGLAQALLGEPDLLILDEPQSGLDPAGRRQVREILMDQKRLGVTVVFSSHIVPDVEAVADRVAMIRDGRLDRIRDLRAAGAGTGAFTVIFAAPPDGGETAGVAAAPGLTVTARAADRWTVSAADAGALGRVLAACHADGLTVHGVGPSGGADLEAEFLDTATATPAPEVVPC
jgi:ABC-2 type transport system ATP-binding protein